MPDNLSAVPVTAASCTPFELEVMIASPESGFKFEVLVERKCQSPTEGSWKLVFDLYQKPDGGTQFEKIIHISYTASTPLQEKKLAAMALDGVVTSKQGELFVTNVHPAVKSLEKAKDKPDQFAKRKEKVKKEMSNTVDAGLSVEV